MMISLEVVVVNGTHPAEVPLVKGGIITTEPQLDTSSEY